MAVTQIKSKQQLAITDHLSFGGAYRITNLVDPSAAQDAATKAYVDAVVQSLDIKASVRAATTANITLSGTQTVDGVALSVGDRVLVKAQTTGSQNGIYVVAAGAWSRASDADTSAKVTAGMYTFVSEGTANGNYGWVLTTDDTIVLDTTALVFTQFNGAGSYIDGAGLLLTGSTFSVNVTGVTTAIITDNVAVAASSTQYQVMVSGGGGNTTEAAWGSINLASSNAVGTSILPVANGGSGRASTTAYMPIVGGTTSTGAEQSVATGTTNGQALLYQGNAAVPSFGAIALGDTTGNIVSGTLRVANGGTGGTSFTQYGVIVGNAGNALAVTSAGTTGQYLKSGNGAANPAFATIDISEITSQFKKQVKAATTASVTLAGGTPNTLDGVSLSVNDRILVKDQATASQNGIYYVSTLGTGANGTWTRATDMDTAAEAASAFVSVDQGSTNAGKVFYTKFKSTDTLGTTSLAWLEVVDVSSTQTLTNKTWNGAVIGAQYGGTGASTYAVGDILYADTTTSLAKLADVATGNALISGGVNTAPSWGKIGLTTHISGTLAVGNGGTGQTTYTDGQLLIGNSTGNTLTKATLTQGTGITVTNGGGSITIAVSSAVQQTSGFVDRETPTGTVNGVNATFTLANTPIAGSEHVYVNGQLMDSGAGNDYTISTNTITFLTGAIPQTGDKVRVSYRK